MTLKQPAEDVAEARRKQKIVEQELIEMNLDILSAEDAKTGKFREQAGYLRISVVHRKRLASLILRKLFSTAWLIYPNWKKISANLVTNFTCVKPARLNMRARSIYHATRGPIQQGVTLTPTFYRANLLGNLHLPDVKIQYNKELIFEDQEIIL